MTTKTKMISGLSFEISQPYAEGHVCTAAEAKALNQVRSENIGNNLRDVVKKAQEAGDLTGLAEKVATYDAEYIFNVSTARVPVDPVEKEAVRIATGLVKDALANKGMKINVAPAGYTDETWKAKIEDEIERVSGLDNVIKVAKKRVDERKKTSNELAEAVSLEA